ncbi:formate dehydrogenase subunit gamma [Paraburkholderia bannensis]|uniref:Formate dehydrogenase subunit gamma n=1 Tax=Paraburkholderia bannensis TaxID=765414 RepID=A0A7W9TU07_9BURK|nr:MULTISPECIES: NAD(P)H-dependent oxidoreductase subunit E [Paraburkholderia]MBB3255574.1 formate dehydrogenase subunit gamma [Paraburkholderia sp. WP4_3_2]MBB6100415.1 formate dehydrogenase subunit gamma [Paraburkholderia bannensis]
MDETKSPSAALSSATAEALVQRHALPGRTLLAILHAIQDELGYVPPAAIAPLGKTLNLSRAEVHGVLTYYHHFRTAPPAPVVVQLCRAEACRSMGGEALAQHAEAQTGCRFGAHEPASAHCVALESVYCLGQCALSPAMMINGSLHAKVTPQKFDALLANALAATAATARTEEAA